MLQFFKSVNTDQYGKAAGNPSLSTTLPCTRAPRELMVTSSAGFAPFETLMTLFFTIVCPKEISFK
jgi:hypothetical protein